jgi:hypothetical protein
MHALIRFSHIAAGNASPPPKSTPPSSKKLGCVPEHYTLASLRYELSKLRAKGLVAKLPNSRRYQLLPQGYSICLVFLTRSKPRRALAGSRRTSSWPRCVSPSRITVTSLKQARPCSASQRPHKFINRSDRLAIFNKTAGHPRTAALDQPPARVFLLDSFDRAQLVFPGPFK